MAYGRIDHVPSVWDYISQGLSQGAGGFFEAKQAEQDRQHKLAMEQLSLYQQGILPQEQNASLSQNLVKLGILPQGTMLPESSSQEQRRLITLREQGTTSPVPLAGGATGMVKLPGQLFSNLTDRQSRLVGEPTQAEKQQTSLGIERAKLGIQESQLGIQKTQNELANRPFELAQQGFTRAANIQTLIDKPSKAFVAAEIERPGLGGRPRKAEDIGKAAANNFFSYATKDLGNLGLNEQDRSAVEQRFIAEAISQQHAKVMEDLDAERLRAQIRLSNAQAEKAARGAQNPRVPSSISKDIESGLQVYQEAKNTLSKFENLQGNATGPVDATLGAISGFFHKGTKPGQINAPESIDARNALANLRALIVHPLFGSAFTPTEQRQLVGLVPSRFDDEETFVKPNLRALINTMDGMLDLKLKTYGANYDMTGQEAILDAIRKGGVASGISDTRRKAYEAAKAKLGGKP